jgi:hypothetical protein
MEFADESRESRQAMQRGIADLDDVARQAQDRDRLPRRGAVSLGNQHPERFWNLRGKDHANIISTSPAVVLPNLPPLVALAAPSAGAAMQRYSWTNNPRPVILAGPAGPLNANGV